MFVGFCLCRRPVRGTVILDQVSDQSIGLRRRDACEGSKASAGDLVEVFETPPTHELCRVDCYVLESEGFARSQNELLVSYSR